MSRQRLQAGMELAMMRQADQDYFDRLILPRVAYDARKAANTDTDNDTFAYILVL